MIEITKSSYAGWKDCLRISNQIIECIIPTQIGPRIIKFSYKDQENEFGILKDQEGMTGGSEWRLYGGHRLWCSPEHKYRTYLPDNDPIDYEEIKNGVRLIQPTEEESKIQKEITINIKPDAAEVKVIHKIINRGLWEVELAPWAITVMKKGGKAIMPFPVGDPDQLLPDRKIVFWPYSNINDPRLQLEDGYIFLNDKEDVSQRFKIGAPIRYGWIAYWNQDHLFVKKFDFKEGRTYPDDGCSAEIYVDKSVLELETLGPLTKLGPEESVEHTEIWSLFKNVPIPRNKNDVKNHILPKISE
jgi:hypothetical protein